MLAPRASSAFVCLRCELTLARPRLAALPRRIPHASFSSSSRRRGDALDDELERLESNVKPLLSEHPLGRVRKRNGHAIRETTARLEGAKALGEDAAILVLEGLGEGKRDITPEPEVIKYNDDQLPLKLAEALADEKPATLEEVVEQLDKLRQKATNDEATAAEGHYVSQAVFTRLSDHLLRAFTSAQLSHYYSQRKGVGKNRVAHEVREGLKELHGKAKRPSERSEWTPGTTQIDRRLPSLNVHSRKKRGIGKHLLVDQILRDVWKLVMLEELETAGEIELALKDWQLVMLTSGANQTALDKIGKTRMAKLEVSAADKVVRITADKHTAEYTADDVEQLLQASESLRVNLKDWSPLLEIDNPTVENVFPQNVLSTVGSLTGAYLQRATDTIIIRALDKETVAEAKRCLIRLMPLKNPIPVTVDTTARETLVESDNLLPIAVEEEALEYQLRNTKLARWSLPIKKGKPIPPWPHSVAERIKRAQEQVFKTLHTPPPQYEPTTPNGKSKALRKWAYHPEFRLRANFGHALFPLEGSVKEEPYFVPALPGLSSVFKPEVFKTSYVTRPTLCYEFIAQPGPKNYTPDRLPYKFPKFTMYFRPDTQGLHGLSKAVLSFGAANHRVLLPEETVDIQFQTTLSLPMYDAKRHPGLAPVREEVLHNLQNGGRLHAPDVLLDIPKWTVEGMEFDGKEDFVRTKYLFTGIKSTQSIWGNHQEDTVAFATEQSGSLGAKTATFSTVYGIDATAKRIVIKDTSAAVSKFVADAFKMAGKITDAAFTSRRAMEKIERRPRQQAIPNAQTRPIIKAQPHTTTNTARTKKVIESEADLIAQLEEAGMETSTSTQVQSTVEDPQFSGIPMNDEPGDNSTETLSREETTEEEQKRRSESTA